MFTFGFSMYISSPLLTNRPANLHRSLLISTEIS